MKRFLPGLFLLLCATGLLAQSSTPDDATATPSGSPSAEDVAAAVTGLVGGGICCFVVWGGMIAIWLFVAIWIMKDAKKRNSPNATLVTVLGWLVWPIGLIVHLATRPKTISDSTTRPPQ